MKITKTYAASEIKNKLTQIFIAAAKEPVEITRRGSEPYILLPKRMLTELRDQVKDYGESSLQSTEQSASAVPESTYLDLSRAVQEEPISETEQTVEQNDSAPISITDPVRKQHLANLRNSLRASEQSQVAQDTHENKLPQKTPRRFLGILG